MCLLWMLIFSLALSPPTSADELLSPESPVLSPPTKFERIVIDSNFPGGYQVEVADVNGDKKPDIVALGGSTLAWYENPTWKKRVVSTAKQTPDIISSATADLDGDGKAEIAMAYDFAMNDPKRGRLLLAIQGATPDDPWTFKPIIELNFFDDVRNEGAGGFAGGGGGGDGVKGGSSGQSQVLPGKNIPQVLPGKNIPSVHRLRWGVFPFLRHPMQPKSFESGLGLVVAPLFGASAKPPKFDQEPAILRIFKPGREPKLGAWERYSISEAPVLHAIEVINIDVDSPSVILGASNLGVTLFQRNGESTRYGAPTYIRQQLASGAPGEAPKKGASEVHLGRFKDGKKFLATIEPWHGTDVAIYTSESLKPLKFGPRNVIDATLKEGHALWVADVDGDGDDEVFAGYRGGDGGVLMYDFDGKSWTKTVLDPAVTAQDLRGGDIDGDGRPDVVAIGGKSHNVVWYRPIK
jgi:FG-GAP-like repeat